MAKVDVWHKVLSRDWKFVINKPFKIDGELLALGAPFDNSKVPLRRLRLLFETRRIVRDPKDSGVKLDRRVARNAKPTEEPFNPDEFFKDNPELRKAFDNIQALERELVENTTLTEDETADVLAELADARSEYEALFIEDRGLIVAGEDDIDAEAEEKVKAEAKKPAKKPAKKG